MTTSTKSVSVAEPALAECSRTPPVAFRVRKMMAMSSSSWSGDYSIVYVETVTHTLVRTRLLLLLMWRNRPKQHWKSTRIGPIVKVYQSRSCTRRCDYCRRAIVPSSKLVVVFSNPLVGATRVGLVAHLSRVRIGVDGCVAHGLPAIRTWLDYHRRIPHNSPVRLVRDRIQTSKHRPARAHPVCRVSHPTVVVNNRRRRRDRERYRCRAKGRVTGRSRTFRTRPGARTALPKIHRQ